MTIDLLSGAEDIATLRTTLNELIRQINALDGGVFNTSIRSTADGEAVLPASATPGFEITSNYAGFGEVDFWSLANNDVSQGGFYYYQKTSNSTADLFAAVYVSSSGPVLELYDGAGIFQCFIGTSEGAITVYNSLDFNVYVGSSGQTKALTLTPAGRFILPVSVTPASAAAAGVAGTIAWDADFIYVCTATNTWKKVAIATW